MPLADRQIRDQLLDQSEEFRSLAAQHGKYEVRLEELSSKQLPTEQERLEQVKIKKHKLWLKDRMAAMIREYEHGLPTAAAS
jgi:uncharacterized protein YdcH (DUF465 family)